MASIVSFTFREAVVDVVYNGKILLEYFFFLVFLYFVFV